MNKISESSAAIDGLLRFIVGGGVIATILVAPGMAKVLDKPTRAYFKKLDKSQQQRELTRLLYYMKRNGLIKPTSEDYMHGLKITKKAQHRLIDAAFHNLAIKTDYKWDKTWRIVFFDIPEHHRIARRQLVSKLKELGFYQLQQSVWIHPYDCREVIETVSLEYQVQKYLTYIETSYIDNEQALIKRFPQIN